MARIELINVCATLRGGERAASVLPDGRGSTFSIRDLNLSVFDGETLVILGPSGCGKTTLLKIIAGLIAPDSGDVHYDGMSMNAVPPGSRRRHGLPELRALSAPDLEDQRAVVFPVPE